MYSCVYAAADGWLNDISCSRAWLSSMTPGGFNLLGKQFLHERFIVFFVRLIEENCSLQIWSHDREMDRWVSVGLQVMRVV